MNTRRCDRKRSMLGVATIKFRSSANRLSNSVCQATQRIPHRIPSFSCGLMGSQGGPWDPGIGSPRHLGLRVSNGIPGIPKAVPRDSATSAARMPNKKWHGGGDAGLPAIKIQISFIQMRDSQTEKIPADILARELFPNFNTSLYTGGYTVLLKSYLSPYRLGDL